MENEKETAYYGSQRIIDGSAAYGMQFWRNEGSGDLTSLTLDEIIEGAKEEGEVASVGMPDDWANWAGSWQALSDQYGISHTDSDMSSAEELSTFENEKDAPTKDIGDVGQAFGPMAVEMDVVQPYKAKHAI